MTASANGTRIWQTRVTFKTGNGAQILVDRAEVILGHVLKLRPWHYLKKWPKLRMRMIRINASSHDVAEFFIRCTTFRPARLIGS